MRLVQAGKVKVLFLSPERFFIENFSNYQQKISLICVDEIHCASNWSHNFRPTYLKLHDMIKDKIGTDINVLGLTATATRAS
jgi:superfamily II DNA helicase RecQ